ncbi:MAG: ribbon-helix-helix protein, CopG family [Candidatus Micrarchaeota archaeon]
MDKTGNHILSFSLKESEVEELDEMQKVLGIESRSRMLRLALKSLYSERKLIENFRGTVSAVIAVSHSTGSDAKFATLRHEFDEIVKTQIHSSMQGGCTDLLLVEGSADEVRGMYSAIRADPKVKNVKILMI